MYKNYQVTMFCGNGAYKPMSCIVRIEQEFDTDLSKDKIKRKDIINKGIVKICNKRRWTQREIKEYNYTKAKIRVVE